MAMLQGMAVRPQDLKDYRAHTSVLHCGECVIDYSALPSDYVWMFPTDLIVCEGCGAELVMEEKTVVD